MASPKAMSVHREVIFREEMSGITCDSLLEVKILVFTTRVLGMSSKVPRNNRISEYDGHIFMMDSVPLSDIEYMTFRELIMQQCIKHKTFGYIIRSSTKPSGLNSYHAIIPHVFTEREIMDMTFELKGYADMLFYALGEKRGEWDLRITSKGEGTGDSPTLTWSYLPFYESRKTIRPISNAHYLIMKRYLNITEIPNDHAFIKNGNLVNRILMRYSVSK